MNLRTIDALVHNWLIIMNMQTLLNKQTQINEAALQVIAHMPTKSLSILMDDQFARSLSDRDYMKIAVFLAQKSYDEGGCPIGAVIVNNSTKEIVGKGHNTLVQEDHPYNHGETSAIRDAGRIDFSQATIYTSLSPCSICASLLHMRGFARVVVGDVTNANGSESFLQEKGIHVDINEDQKGIALYARFRLEKPDQDLEDWKGLSAVLHKRS
jgi:cytosine deaminase